MNTGNQPDSSIAILCLTRNGARQGHKLAARMPGSHLFLPDRLRKESEAGSQAKFFDDFAACFSRVFRNYAGMICIMASGIVVRSLGGLMTSKYKDPAVVVVDEKGRYAISLLSGHQGGANSLAKMAAAYLGGQAVITTATDVNGKPAVDMMARDIDALIKPPGNIKLINRALAEGETVYLYSPWPLNPEWGQGFVSRPWRNATGGLNGIETDRIQAPAVVLDCRYSPRNSDELIFLLPRNLHLGIGCRKGVDYEQLKLAVRTVLDVFCIDKGCIVSLASIDIKAREAALLRLARELQLPLRLFAREELAVLEGSFEGSEWVKQNIGVDGVCEPAARLAAKTGTTIVPKQKIGPVTISVAMEKSWWWDWDQEIRIF